MQNPGPSRILKLCDRERSLGNASRQWERQQRVGLRKDKQSSLNPNANSVWKKALMGPPLLYSVRTRHPSCCMDLTLRFG